MENDTHKASQSSEEPGAQKPSGVTVQLVAIGVIACISYVVASLVTPADPISMLVAFVLIFVLLYSTYLYGYHSGKGDSQDASSDIK